MVRTAVCSPSGCSLEHLGRVFVTRIAKRTAKCTLISIPDMSYHALTQAFIHSLLRACLMCIST